MTEPVSENIKWHEAEIDTAERTQLLGQSGGVIWLTGLSGSGKSTIARRIEALLLERKQHVFVLDGDNVRFGLCSDLGFSAEDRKENIRRVRETAKLIANANVTVLCAFISPYRSDRDAARSLMGDRFLEVYCAANVDACEARDPKGLYAKARQGEIQNFTGISAPYEAPETADIVLDTANESIDSCAKVVAKAVVAKGWLG